MANMFSGYMCAVSAMILLGLWEAMIKQATRTYGVHPAVMNVYFMVGFFAVSWVGTLSSVYIFSVWGLLSGALLWTAAAITLSVTFPLLGIAVATAASSSVSIVTSFIWTVCVYGNATRSVGLSIVGIAIVIVGLVGVTFAGFLGRIGDGGKKLEVGGGIGEASRLLPAASEGGGTATSAGDGSEIPVGSGLYAAGIFAAIVAGTIGGSVLVPLHYATVEGDDDDEAGGGLEFIVSMGIGVLAFTPFGFLFQLWMTSPPPPSLSSSSSSSSPPKPKPTAFEWPDFMIAKASPWGLSAGITYGGATVLQIIAVDTLDYAAAYTITQANLVVTGLTGIVIFNELKGTAIPIFFVAAVLVLGGAGMVSYYGTTAR